jgi:DNA-directed RNA polymerase specialized sigma24 family protein
VIARFKAVSECRREARSTSASTLIEDPADDPATFVLKRQRSDILQKCLAPLTSLHRDVITLITTREGRARRSLD